MTFNRKKFMEAIVAMAADQAPLSPPSASLQPSFAQFMAANAYGIADSTDAAILANQNDTSNRNEGALSKVFGWLTAPMRAVESSVMDVADQSQSFGEKWKNVGLDIAGGVANLAQPAMEVAAIPGVKTPWEDLVVNPEVNKFVENQSKQYHGTGAISGQRLLEEGFGVDPSHNVRNAIAGLGLDLALDPLSYIGVGAFTKAKPAAKALEEAAAATEKVGVTPFEAAAAPSKLLKPPSNFQRFTLPGLSPIRGATTTTTLGNLATPASVTGVARSTLQDALKNVLNPKQLKEISAIRAGDYKLYEKLRPVVYPERVVPSRPEFASYEEVGQNLSDFLVQGEAKALSREEQVTLFDQMLDEVPKNISSKTVAEKKYLMKGMEDSLAQRGYTFPEGKLSEYLHSTKDASLEKLQEFAKGKPLKERPMDASLEQKLMKARKAQGRNLLEAKLQKTYPRAVTTPHGINSRVVKEAIDRVNAGAFEPIYQIPKAKGAEVIKMAIDKAEHYKDMMGKTVGGVVRRAELNPANQANLYKQMWEGTAQLIKDNPEMLKRFTDKSGKFVHDSAAARKWRRQTSLSMLKTAEEHLAKKYGLSGVHWGGSGLRLSTVIEELGPKALDEHITKVLDAFAKGNPNLVTDPVAKRAIADAIARRNMESGAVAKVILDDYARAADAMERTVSRQKFLEWKNGEALKRARFAGAAAGLSKQELEAAIDLVKNRVNVEGVELMEPFQILDTLGANAVRAVAEGHADAKLIKKMNIAIRDALNETAKAQRLDTQAETALDGFLMRFTTWYGRGDMVHYSREAGSYIEDWAKKRAEWFNFNAKNYSSEEVIAAFKNSQGHWKNVEAARIAAGTTTPLVSERVAELSTKITDYFENIVASTRTINDVDKLKGSVAIRSQMMMDDINKQLKAVGSKFQFIGSPKVKRNIAGNPADYSEGNWLTSWENVDPTKFGQDPLHFMYDLSLATDRVVSEYAMIDEFVMRFGRLAGEVDFQPLIHTHGLFHPRVAEGIKFPQEAAQQFQKLLNDIEKGSWIPETKFIREMVKYQRIWKTGVTMYNPSFHVRNAIGDTFLMWMAGHNNPIYFKYAMKMIYSQRARYKEAIQAPTLGPLEALMGKEQYGLLQSKGTDVLLRRNGANLTTEEIYGEAVQRGMLLDANRAADIIGEPLFAHTAGRNPNALKRFAQQPLGGVAHSTAVKITEVREHYIRLAHFSSAINKQLTAKVASKLRAIENDKTIINKVAARRKVLEPIYESASREVRKWHPDGRDLSYFEQKYMRNIIPFYSWQRKAIPLLIESMLTQPAKLTAYPKVSFAAQNALGIPAPSMSDPFPTDQLYPDWMRESGIGPIGDPQSDNAVAAWFGRLGRNALLPGWEGEYGRTVINPGNPFNDMVVQYGRMGTSPIDSIKGSSSLLTPYFNIPKEALSGTSWTGAPIATEAGGAGYTSWAASQVPILSMLNRIPRVGMKSQQNVEPGLNTEALINILTALGVRGSGQYLKSAQFDARYR